MPKRVDRQARREAIAEAVLRIASREGIAAVSIGNVATEAAISKGLVQHYFASKEAMLLFASSFLRARVEARVRRQREALENPTPRTILRSILLSFLPVDEERRAEALIASTSFVRAITEPALADRFRTGHVIVLAMIAEQIAAARAEGSVPKTARPAEEAILLLALLRGVTAHMLFDYQTIEEATATLDLALDRLFTMPERGARDG